MPSQCPFPPPALASLGQYKLTRFGQHEGWIWPSQAEMGLYTLELVQRACASFSDTQGGALNVFSDMFQRIKAGEESVSSNYPLR